MAGRVARPHGLDGSFVVAEPEAALLGVGASVTVAGAVRRIAGRKGTDARPLVRLDGVSDRDAAAALRGEALLVARTEAPALEEGEYWASDLEGCLVVDGEREVGEVVRLVALPSCEVLEVRRFGAGSESGSMSDSDSGSGSGDVLLVPLVRDAVREVDVTARRIDVDLRFLDAD